MMYHEEIEKEPEVERKGYEWLESDVEIFNLLLEKQQEGDEILNLFNIQFMDDSYTNEDMEEIKKLKFQAIQQNTLSLLIDSNYKNK